MNDKIDGNEKLHNAKVATTEKIGALGSAVASKWSSFSSSIWGKKKEEPGALDNQEEEKQEEPRIEDV